MSGTEHCDRSAIDPESWIEVATEKLDDLIDHIVGSRLGHGQKASIRSLPEVERCSNYVVYQPPLLKKSVDSTGKNHCKSFQVRCVENEQNKKT